MLVYPDIDPVAFAVGPVKVHWYGIMYVVGFVAGWWLARRRAAMPGSTWKPIDVDDLIFFAAVGVIVGGRIGWILVLRLRCAARGSARDHPRVAGRHVVPRRPRRRHGGDRALCPPPRPPHRGRLRFHGPAARRRAVRGPDRQFHQRRALGQADGPALGLPVQGRGAASVPALRGRTGRHRDVRGPVVVHVQAAADGSRRRDSS